MVSSGQSASLAFLAVTTLPLVMRARVRLDEQTDGIQIRKRAHHILPAAVSNANTHASYRDDHIRFLIVWILPILFIFIIYFSFTIHIQWQMVDSWTTMTMKLHDALYSVLLLGVLVQLESRKQKKNIELCASN